MKRHLKLQQSFSTRHFDVNAWAIEIPIAALDIVPLVCEISMLLYDRSDQLSLLFDRGRKIALSISHGEARVTGSDDNPVALKLNRTDAEFILSFLLTWYRDGVAEASHVDIEVIGSQDAGTDCTLVLVAERSRPPLEEAEARKILRDME